MNKRYVDCYFVHQHPPYFFQGKVDASVSLSVGEKISFRSQLFHPFSTSHAGNAKDDEWNAQQLSHVENHARLEVNLYILGVFYEEAERENEG